MKSIEGPLLYLALVVWVITIASLFLEQAHFDSKMDCFAAPGATIITTASGHKMCVSGRGMVWL